MKKNYSRAGKASEHTCARSIMAVSRQNGVERNLKDLVVRRRAVTEGVWGTRGVGMHRYTEITNIQDIRSASCVSIAARRLVILSVSEHQDGVVNLESGAELHAHDLDDISLRQQKKGFPVDLLLSELLGLFLTAW